MSIAQSQAVWKAGFAAVDITPNEPMWMAGYASRTKPAEGTDSKLWTRAAVMEAADGKRFVLVSLDLVGISRTVSEGLAQPILKKYKLPREALVFAISHTHSGPVVGSTLRTMYFFDESEAKKVDDYAKELPAKVLEAVDAATAKLEPVSLAWGNGTTDFAVNRRENREGDVPSLRAQGKLKGPDDHAVPVLVATNAKGTITGIIFGYACHATTLAGQKWSADYPGFACSEIEKQLPTAVAIFFAGCGADQNPIPRRTLELAKKYGKQLGEAVVAVAKKPAHSLPKATWHGVYREIALPLEAIPTRDALVEESTSTNKYIASRARMLLKKLADEGSLPKTYPYPVQTWKLGDLTWVMLGGEVVVDYSLRIKKELGADSTWVMGYANDIMAYIPSLRVLKEGGYEGATAMIYYGLPTIWGKSVEEKIMEEVHLQSK